MQRSSISTSGEPARPCEANPSAMKEGLREFKKRLKAFVQQMEKLPVGIRSRDTPKSSKASGNREEKKENSKQNNHRIKTFANRGEKRGRKPAVRTRKDDKRQIGPVTTVLFLE